MSGEGTPSLSRRTVTNERPSERRPASSGSSARAPSPGPAAARPRREGLREQAAFADERDGVRAEGPGRDRHMLGRIAVDRRKRVSCRRPLLDDAVQEREREAVPGEDQLAVPLDRFGGRVRRVARVAAERVEDAGLKVALPLQVRRRARRCTSSPPYGREPLDEQGAVQRDEERRVARLRQEEGCGSRPELQAAEPRQRRERVRQAGLRVELRASAPTRSRRCRAARLRGTPPPTARTARPTRGRSGPRPRRARAGR